MLVDAPINVQILYNPTSIIMKKTRLTIVRTKPITPIIKLIAAGEEDPPPIFSAKNKKMRLKIPADNPIKTFLINLNLYY